MVIQTFFLIFLGLSEKFPKTSKWFNDLASHPTYKYAVELLYPGDPKKLLQVSASVRGLLSLSRVIFPWRYFYQEWTTLNTKIMKLITIKSYLSLTLFLSRMDNSKHKDNEAYHYQELSFLDCILIMDGQLQTKIIERLLSLSRAIFPWLYFYHGWAIPNMKPHYAISSHPILSKYCKFVDLYISHH